MRPMTSRANYWSQHHHDLLVGAARVTCAAFGLHRKRAGDYYGIVIDELVNIGWLEYLRRVPEAELRNCYNFLIGIMYEAVRRILSQQTRYHRQHYPATLHRVGGWQEIDAILHGEAQLCPD